MINGALKPFQDTFTTKSTGIQKDSAPCAEDSASRLFCADTAHI